MAHVIDPVIEIKVTNMQGVERTLRARNVSNEALKKGGEWERVFEDGPKSINQTETLENKLAAQMAWIFGGKKEDYFDLDIRMQRAAVTIFIREYNNPSL
jgi:hypothetical protein